jgi:WhiB family redox-sensing transcriptional regulator
VSALPAYTGREPCRTGDPDRFFPEHGSWRLSSRRAKAECKSCPLLNSCFDYALHNDVEGIWGGTSYEDRKRMRRKYKIVAERILPTEAELMQIEMRQARLGGLTVGQVADQFGVSKRHAQRVTSLGRDFASVAS